LQASFLQPNGPSLPGTDWAVELDDGGKIHKVLVRAYKQSVAGLSQEQEIQAVVNFVFGLLQRVLGSLRSG
jgi:hypothetical protein